TLHAGEYTLRLDNPGFNPADYGFRLLDLAAAPAVTPGQVIDLCLPASGEARVYSVEVQAGDRLYLDLRELAESYASYNPASGRY
ncbi:hypothetical protein, partial [Parachitinimonas caeni]